MARNRYARDYRLVETWDEKGKLKVSSEYIGEEYRFVADASVIAGKKKKLILLCMLGWIGFFAALSLYSAGMHTLYVALPFVFSAVPLTFLTDITFSFRKMKEPLEHRHADRMNSRFPLSALMTALFSAFALIGEAVNVILGKTLAAGDYVLMAGGLAVFAAGALAFMEKKNVEIMPVSR